MIIDKQKTIEKAKSMQTRRSQEIMMSRFPQIVVPVVVLVLLLVTSGCTTQSINQGNSKNTGLTILVDDPHQLENVRNLAVQYENKTGMSVAVQQVPSGLNPDSGNLPHGDLLIAGISRIPGYAAGGKLDPLNTYLNSSPTVNWTIFERPPLVMVGEYPDHSGDIYALPFYQDALGLVYRADLFNDLNESAAFCSTYGAPLAAPGSYEELATLADFFTRNDSHLSGIGFAGLESSDPLSSPWLSLASSYGSGIYGRSSGLASGTWNSSSMISSLTMLRNLSRYEPHGSDKWGDQEVADAMSSGTTAMAITWFSQFPGIQSAAEKHNLSVGYTPLPGEITEAGSFRGITVRMDGIGVVRGGSQDRALEFLTWFYSPEVQYKYAESGYQPAAISVLDSFPYLSLNLYNRAFPESMRIGVTLEKGEHAEAVRLICEDAIRAILSAEEGKSPEEIMRILNASAASIDSIRQKSGALS